MPYSKAQGLELPATGNAEVVVATPVVVVAVDNEGPGVEAPNIQLLVSIIFLLTPCIGQRASRIELGP